MTARRFSALQVAEGAGVDERTIALWLAAEVEPQLFRADQAAQLLGSRKARVADSPALRRGTKMEQKEHGRWTTARAEDRSYIVTIPRPAPTTGPIESLKRVPHPPGQARPMDPDVDLGGAVGAGADLPGEAPAPAAGPVLEPKAQPGRRSPSKASQVSWMYSAGERVPWPSADRAFQPAMMSATGSVAHSWPWIEASAWAI